MLDDVLGVLERRRAADRDALAECEQPQVEELVSAARNRRHLLYILPLLLVEQTAVLQRLEARAALHRDGDLAVDLLEVQPGDLDEAQVDRAREGVLCGDAA